MLAWQIVIGVEFALLAWWSFELMFGMRAQRPRMTPVMKTLGLVLRTAHASAQRHERGDTRQRDRLESLIRLARLRGRLAMGFAVPAMACAGMTAATYGWDLPFRLVATFAAAGVVVVMAHGPAAALAVIWATWRGWMPEPGDDGGSAGPDLQPVDPNPGHEFPLAG